MASAHFAKLASQVMLCPGPHEQISVVAPFDGSRLGTLPACHEADVDFAIASARAVQADWAARSVSERARIFLRFHDLLLDRQNEILDLIQLETGKARRYAFEEILDTAVVSRHYARCANRLLRPRRRRGALPLLTKTWELKCPVGVVGFIVPWNFPLTLAVTDAVPALLAGNTAVIKPDLQTGFTALWAATLLREAGLPPNVFSVITGEGPVVGPALANRADYVMFTGSTRIGKLVARQAADRLAGCSLELGGKNPMIVRHDADLTAVVEGAVHGCFTGAGQVCVSIERIYVHETLFARFVDLFAERTKRLRLGSALDYSIDVGSLTSERQLKVVEQHVGDALEKGATLVAGGRRRPDLGCLFYEPTILTEVRPGMKVYAEETFGPVVSVYPFSTDAEAIVKANETSYGLNASIWTRDTRLAVQLAAGIQSGSVNVNESYAAVWGSVDSPMEAWKESGLNARHGVEGLLKFTKTQTVAVQRLVPIGPAHWMNPEVHARWMTRLVKLIRHIRLLG